MLLIVGMVLLAVGLIAAAIAGMNPAALGALTGSAACIAGISGIVFQAMGRWAGEPGYLLPRKMLAAIFLLSGAGMALVFWSSFL